MSPNIPIRDPRRRRFWAAASFPFSQTLPKAAVSAAATRSLLSVSTSVQFLMTMMRPGSSFQVRVPVPVPACFGHGSATRYRFRCTDWREYAYVSAVGPCVTSKASMTVVPGKLAMSASDRNPPAGIGRTERVPSDAFTGDWRDPVVAHGLIVHAEKTTMSWRRSIAANPGSARGGSRPH